MHTLKQSVFARATAVCGVALLSAAVLVAGQPAPPTQSAPGSKPAAPAPAAAGLVVPADYIIGPDDVLGVFVWNEKDVSGDVTVRPDGKISLPLLNDIQAAGLTPEQLRAKLTEAATKNIKDPTVTIVVRQINSRKVFITGNVTKPGPYPLTAPITVLQLISMAGGLAEYAKGKEIVVIRSGVPTPFKVNYNELKKGKNLKQNIELKPGDQIVVP